MTVRERCTVGWHKVKSAVLIELLRVFAVWSQTAYSVFLGMGESNCAWNRKALLHRDTMLAAAAVYRGKEAHRSATRMHWGTCPLSCLSLTIASAFSFPFKALSDFLFFFQNTDPIAPYPFSKQSLLFPYYQLLKYWGFLGEAFPESCEHPNIHFSLEDMTFIKEIIFPTGIFSDCNHYLS